MKKVECNWCGKVVERYPCELKMFRNSYCSNECLSEWKRGRRASPDTEFKKGVEPWITGRHHMNETKNKISEKNKGKRYSIETEFKKGLKPWNKGKDFLDQYEDHWAWKGDSASNVAHHAWVKRRKGKAKKCIDCGAIEGLIVWSNKDHRYRRVLSDYKQRCAKCHRRYDIETGIYGLGVKRFKLLKKINEN